MTTAEPRPKDSIEPARVALSDLFDLRGKVAIVTGGGGGLGVQSAEVLAEAGAAVVLCARRKERCEETARLLQAAHSVEARAFQCDVRNGDEIATVVEQTVNDLGRIDILVNNAGTSWGAPTEDYPLGAWQNVVDVNLTGVFLFSQAAARQMIAQGDGGKIVNLSSIAASNGFPAGVVDAIAYSASKGGVEAITRDLAAKWAPHGINVNAVAPGWFRTDMSGPVLDRNGEELLAKIPLGRFGGPSDLKGGVLYLATRASDFVTGHTLMVDGGQSVT